jgi:TPR repeat protein
LYAQSAEQGNAQAQFNLGVAYKEGTMVGTNYAKAHMFYNLAATNGHKDAAKERDELAKKMSRSEIEKAQGLARDWIQKRKCSGIYILGKCW